MPQWFGTNKIGKLENLGSNILELKPSFLKISGKAVKTSNLQLNLNTIGLGGLAQGPLEPDRLYSVFAVLEKSVVYLVAGEEADITYPFYLTIASFNTDNSSNVSNIVQDYLTDTYLDYFSEINDVSDFEIASIQCSNFKTKFLTNHTWTDLDYGNGVYLVVGNANKFAFSSNADSFEISNTNKNYNSCVFGKKLFVLVGNNSFSYTFSGSFIINPKNVQEIPNRNWVDVINFGDKYYALASNGDVLEFNQESIFGNDTYNLKICNILSLSQKELSFGNDFFVSVGSGIATSSNLSSWEISNSSESFLSVAFGKGKFFTITSSKIYTSVDGLNWNLVKNAESNQNFLKIKYTGGIFIVTGLNTFLISLDGLTWVSKIVPTGNSYNNVVFGKGNFLSINSSSSNFLLSFNR